LGVFYFIFLFFILFGICLVGEKIQEKERAGVYREYSVSGWLGLKWLLCVDALPFVYSSFAFDARVSRDLLDFFFW
jgi:hypothetical protein